MPQIAWHESSYWLAAGRTMFQFLGIGALLWAFGGLLRRALSRNQPEVRYASALGLLLATVAIPVGLFVTALNSAGKLTAKHDLQSTTSSQPSIGRQQTGPVPSEASAVGGTAPRMRERTALGSRSLETSIAWKSALTSGWDIVRDVACRLLPWLWVSGAPLILVQLACGLNGVGRLRRAGRPLREGDVVAAHERLRTALRISRHVAIFACDRVAAPILVGILRPAILLPPAVLAGFSPEQMEMILLHELAHVRRCDNLVNFVQRVIEAVLFFHPVVWWLSSWVRLEREECCDRIVVQHTGRPQEYAETLAALAIPGITPRHAAAAIADGHLVTRIRHILNLEDEVMKNPQKAFVTAAGLLIFVGCFAASFGQQPGVATPSVAQKPSVTDAAGEPVSVPFDATIGYLEAVQRAIQAGSIQESESLPIIGEIFEGLALDERAGESIQGLRFHSTATQRGVGFLIAQLAGAPRKWGPEQATGAPDSPDYPNNQGTAWCPATADGQEEWLELTYGEPIEPLVLVVYECLKPGALVRVLAYDTEGNELNAWSGKDPSPADSGNGSAISVVPLKLKKIKVVRLRLVFDSQHVEGWNEIDAAGILDVKGAIHWATAATASSTWVDPTAASATFSSEPLSEIQGLDSKVHMIELRGGAIDPVSAALGGVLTVEGSTALLKSIQGVTSVLDTDPRVAGYELLFADPTRGNATHGGAADRVSLFEERIKKLESDLAGLREALQQLKSRPGDQSAKP